MISKNELELQQSLWESVVATVHIVMNKFQVLKWHL